MLQTRFLKFRSKKIYLHTVTLYYPFKVQYRPKLRNVGVLNIVILCIRWLILFLPYAIRKIAFGNYLVFFSNCVKGRFLRNPKTEVPNVRVVNVLGPEVNA